VGSAVYAALIEPDPLERAVELGRTLEPLGPEALDAVRGAYDAVVLDVGDVEFVLFAEWWARFDPPAAFDWARASRVGWHPAVLSAVARAWARQDPEAAALAVERSVTDSRLRAASLLGLVRGWEESGRDGLAEYLGRQTDPQAVQQAIDALARGKVLREGPEAAIAWAEALPDDPDPAELKLNAHRRVAGAIVELDPERAAAWAARQVGGPYASGLLMRVGTAWAERDGAAAMRWLSTLPADRALPNAVQETYRTWFLRGREEASEWLRAAKPEPWLEPAVSVFALYHARENPREALSWAERLSESGRRDRTLIGIALAWLRQAPEEAQAWLDQAELSENVRNGLARIRARLRPTDPAALPASGSAPLAGSRPGGPGATKGAPAPADALPQ
jgi:hypothetical protein